MADEIERVDLSDELIADLQQINAEKKYRWLKFQVEETISTLSAVRDKVKTVDSFWLHALASVPELGINSASDREALAYLTDVELKQDPSDPRPYELVFHFKENPFFSNTTLSKKYALPKTIAPIKDGKVTAESFEYDQDDFVITSTKPDWKSKDKNLTKKYPRSITQSAEDETDFEGDIGSFFVYFEEAGDQLQIGHTLQDELLPDLLEHLFSPNEAELDFDELSDEEDDDDDEGSVDLEEEEEQPKKKKQKQ